MILLERCIRVISMLRNFLPLVGRVDCARIDVLARNDAKECADRSPPCPESLLVDPGNAPINKFY